jgi:hypothetical protein
MTRRVCGPVTLKKSVLTQFKKSMTKRSFLISFFLRLRCLALIMVGATLAPITSFAQQYQETDQVSNVGGQSAKFADPHLLNPWGIARSSTGVWWVSDQFAGVATLYNGEGVAVNPQAAPQPLVVTIPHGGQGWLVRPVWFSMAVPTLTLKRVNPLSSFLHPVMARSPPGIRWSIQRLRLKK